MPQRKNRKYTENMFYQPENHPEVGLYFRNKASQFFSLLTQRQQEYAVSYIFYKMGIYPEFATLMCSYSNDNIPVSHDWRIEETNNFNPPKRKGGIETPMSVHPSVYEWLHLLYIGERQFRITNEDTYSGNAIQLKDEDYNVEGKTPKKSFAEFKF